jgi:hypothetical protein
MSSLWVPSREILDYRARETLINEWDAQWNDKSEGVHSLCWQSQEEGSWRKFRIDVGEYQWVVRY